MLNNHRRRVLIGTRWGRIKNWVAGRPFPLSFFAVFLSLSSSFISTYGSSLTFCSIEARELKTVKVNCKTKLNRLLTDSFDEESGSYLMECMVVRRFRKISGAKRYFSEAGFWNKYIYIYIYKTRYFIPVYFPSLLLKDISRFDREFSISTKSPPLVVIISVTTNDFEFHPYKQFPQAFSAGGTNINTFTSKPNPHHETVAWSHKFMRLNLSFHGELTQWPVEVLAHFSENLPFRTKTLGNVR